MIGKRPVAEVHHAIHFGVSDPEVPGFAPARSLAILDPKILAGLIIPDEQHRMAACVASGSMCVYPACIIEEVIIDVHGCYERTKAVQAVFQSLGSCGRGGNIAPAIYPGSRCFPVSASIGTGSVGSVVGVASLRRQASVSDKVRSRSDISTGTASGLAARDKYLLGLIKPCGRHPGPEQGGLKGSGGRKRPAASAASLVSYRRYKVAAIVPPVEAPRKPSRRLGALCGESSYPPAWVGLMSAARILSSSRDNRETDVSPAIHLWLLALIAVWTSSNSPARETDPVKRIMRIKISTDRMNLIN